MYNILILPLQYSLPSMQEDLIHINSIQLLSKTTEDDRMKEASPISTLSRHGRSIENNVITKNSLDGD